MKKTFHEWTRTRIWSSQTTRRIVWSLLSLSAIAYFWSFLERYWVNPWERRSLLEILRRADVIRHASNEDLDKELAGSKAYQERAEKAVWTNRDFALEAIASGTITTAMLCRRNELRPSDKPEDQRRVDRIRKFACAEYDVQMSYSQAALSSRSGF